MTTSGDDSDAPVIPTLSTAGTDIEQQLVERLIELRQYIPGGLFEDDGHTLRAIPGADELFEGVSLEDLDSLYPEQSAEQLLSDTMSGRTWQDDEEAEWLDDGNERGGVLKSYVSGEYLHFPSTHCTNSSKDMPHLDMP